METELSHEAEEYIEVIYRFQKRNGVAKTTELARKLNIVPGSVTNTIEHLKKHDLVEHEPYRGVKLTDNGRKIASSILRRHRLAERLLTDFLHLDWSEVHDPACIVTIRYACVHEVRPKHLRNSVLSGHCGEHGVLGVYPPP